MFHNDKNPFKFTWVLIKPTAGQSRPENALIKTTLLITVSEIPEGRVETINEAKFFSSDRRG
jgi:hypothetical protein